MKMNKLPYRIIVAASICNASSFIDKVFANINSIDKIFKEVICIFVESNSTDNTLEILTNSKLDIPKEGYSIKNNIHYRTGRIATARNFYLDIVEKKYSDYDYLLVLDFNETNIEPISEASLRSNFKTLDWDMICANQPAGYYDLWALRHPIWMPYDCWEIVNYKKPHFLTHDQIRKIAIESRHVSINEHLPLIQVQSAFGGAGFIKISSIKGARHESLTENGYETCEWPSFCQKLNNGNNKIYINPGFVNQQTLNKHILQR